MEGRKVLKRKEVNETTSKLWQMSVQLRQSKYQMKKKLTGVGKQAIRKKPYRTKSDFNVSGKFCKSMQGA